MLNLVGITHKYQLVSGVAGSLRCHVSAVDLIAGVASVVAPVNAVVVTAATTDLLIGIAGGARNLRYNSVRNDHATLANPITLQHTDGTVVAPMWKGTLAPGEWVERVETGWLYYSASGVLKGPTSAGSYYNQSVANQAGFAADTYLLGSNIAIPNSLPLVFTNYRLKFDVTKTAAGVATPIVTVRIGTVGSVADAARLTFTFPAGTAAVDTGFVEVVAGFRTVGSGVAAVLQGRASFQHGGASVGLVSSGAPTLQVTSAGFDSTVANSVIGASLNGGASAAFTVGMVDAFLNNV